MRKILFPDLSDVNVLIIQEVVFASLSPEHKNGFQDYDLHSKQIVVRDDPSATKLYYKILKCNVTVSASPGLKMAG
jgi:hypothetical protein